MSVNVKPAGTKGARRPPMPRFQIAGMARLFAAWFKRSGAKMRVAGQPLLVQ